MPAMDHDFNTDVELYLIKTLPHGWIVTADEQQLELQLAGKIGLPEVIFLPKSQCSLLGESPASRQPLAPNFTLCVFSIPEWLAEREGLI